MSGRASERCRAEGQGRHSFHRFSSILLALIRSKSESGCIAVGAVAGLAWLSSLVVDRASAAVQSAADSAENRGLLPSL